MRLYEHSAEVRAELDLLIEREGEMTPEDEERMARVFGGFEDKLARCAEALSDRRAYQNHLLAESARMKEHAERVGKDADRLERRMVECMLLAEQRKVEAGTFKLSLRKGRTSVAGAREALKAGKLPSDYVRTVVRTTPDKKLIGDALKRGEEVPGCSLVVGPDSLSVK